MKSGQAAVQIGDGLFVVHGITKIKGQSSPLIPFSGIFLWKELSTLDIESNGSFGSGRHIF